MWQRLCRLDELPQNSARCIEIDGLRLGVFSTSNGFYAMDNTCPHQEGDLHEGLVESQVVFCPLHHWRFRLQDGVSDVGSEFDLPTYNLKEENGWLLIDTQSAKLESRDPDYDYFEDL